MSNMKFVTVLLAGVFLMQTSVDLAHCNDALESIKEGTSEAMKNAQKTFGDFTDSMRNHAEAIKEATEQKVKEAEQQGEEFGSKMREMAGQVKDSIVNAATNAKETVLGKTNEASETMKDEANDVKPNVEDKVNRMKRGTVFDQFSNAAQETPKTFLDGFRDAGEAAKDAINIKPGDSNNFMEQFSQKIGSVQQFPKDGVNFIKDQISRARRIFIQGTDQLKTGIQTIALAIKLMPHNTNNPFVDAAGMLKDSTGQSTNNVSNEVGQKVEKESESTQSKL